MTNRSSRGSDKPAVPQALRARQTDWDPIRGFHQGQRPQVPRQQAGHMIAPDRSGITDFSLAPTGPSTHEALAAAANDAMVRKITALQRIRGIGSNFAAVLVREVLYRSFANRRQLASYVGITPMPYQSGGMDRDRSISRAGNPRARTTLIQLAWLWLRYQPGSALATWFRERVGTLQGRTRRIAIVAMARRLLIALWRYVETGVLPEGVEIRAEAAPMA